MTTFGKTLAWTGVVVGTLTIAGAMAMRSVGAEVAAIPARPSRPPEPEETDHDRLVRETKRTAPYAADEAISAFLKAPSQASFSGRELLRQKENFALVRSTVDAPNAFGVKLRQTWCAIVRFEPPRGDKFVWHRKLGAWECGHGIDEDALSLRRAAAGWTD